jgi:hypothetical protein
MFLSATHILVDKYYPDILIQIIIGCALYIILYSVSRNICTMPDQYKYYVLSLFCIDAIFVILMVKYHNPKKNQDEITNELTELGEKNISRVPSIYFTHDLSLSDDSKNSIFSTTDTVNEEK